MVKLDVATAAMILFALVVVVFLSSLPWIIGAVMDRRRRERAGGRAADRGASVVRGEDFQRRE